MGRACSTYEGKERCIQDCGMEDMKERDHLENLGLMG